MFILGDLFEYWVGDDMLVEPFVARMAALLHTLSERGIALYIMHGNRDFLLGKRFMKAAGAIWLPDPFVITAFGTRVALAHGDGLCTADRGYQLFRRFARNRARAEALSRVAVHAGATRSRRRMRSKSEQGRMRPVSAKYDVTREGGRRAIQASKTAHDDSRPHASAGAASRAGRHALGPAGLGTRSRRARGGYLRIDAEGIRALPLD